MHNIIFYIFIILSEDSCNPMGTAKIKGGGENRSSLDRERDDREYRSSLDREEERDEREYRSSLDRKEERDERE